MCIRNNTSDSNQKINSSRSEIISFSMACEPSKLYRNVNVINVYQQLRNDKGYSNNIILHARDRYFDENDDCMEYYMTVKHKEQLFSNG